MVFIIRDLYSSWEMLIYYFLHATSVINSTHNDLIVKTVQRLLKCGFFFIKAGYVTKEITT